MAALAGAALAALAPPKVIGMRQQFPGVDNLW